MCDFSIANPINRFAMLESALILIAFLFRWNSLARGEQDEWRPTSSSRGNDSGIHSPVTHFILVIVDIHDGNTPWMGQQSFAT